MIKHVRTRPRFVKPILNHDPYVLMLPVLCSLPCPIHRLAHFPALTLFMILRRQPDINHSSSLCMEVCSPDVNQIDLLYKHSSVVDGCVVRKTKAPPSFHCFWQPLFIPCRVRGDVGVVRSSPFPRFILYSMGYCKNEKERDAS